MVVLAVIWILSPLVLIPVSIVYATKYSKLKKKLNEYEYLKKYAENLEKANNDYTKSEKPAEQNITNRPPPQTDYSTVKPVTADSSDSVSDTNYKPANEHKTSINPMNIILITGVVLIALAGIIFSTTNWSIMSNVTKVVTLLSSAVLFYGVGIFAEKKLRLEKLGKAFFMLGSTFLPISVIAVGFFKLLGGWFSLGEYYQSSMIVLMTSFMTLAVTYCIASGKYKSEIFALASLTGTSCTVMCMILILFDDIEIQINLVPVMFAAYSFFVLIAAPRINYHEYFISYRKASEKFIILNTVLFSTAALIYSVATNENASVALIFFGIIFLDKSFNSKYKIFGIFPFAIYILLGLTGMRVPESCKEFIMISCAASLTAIILGETSKVPDELAKALRVFSYSMMGISLISSFASIINSSSTLESAISLLIIYSSSLWILFRHNNKTVKFIHPMLIFAALFHFSMLLPMHVSNCYLAFYAALTICFMIYLKINKLRSAVSDILFTTGTAFFILVNIDNQWLNEAFAGGVCLTIMLISIVFNVYSQKSTVIAGYCVVPSLLLTFSAVTDGFDFNNDFSFLSMRIIYILLIIAVFILPKLKVQNVVTCTKFSKCIEFWLYPIAFYNFTDTVFPYFLILALFCALHIKPTLNFNLKAKALFYTYASITSFVIQTLIYNEEIFSLYIPVFIIFAVTGFVLMAVQISIMQKNAENFFNTPFYISANILLLISLTTVMSDFDYAILPLMISLFIYFYSYLYKGSNVFGVLSSIAVIIFSYIFIRNDLNIDNEVYIMLLSAVFFFISMAIAHFINYRFHTKAIIKPCSKPWLAYFSVMFSVAIIWISLSGDPDLTKWTSVGWFLTAVYAAMFIRKNGLMNRNRAYLSISVFQIAMAAACQELIHIPAEIKSEYFIALALVMCYLYRRIWKGYEEKVDKLTVVTVFAGVVYLLYKIFTYKQLINAMILISAAIVMMIYSFVKRRKKWFLLSAGLVIFLAFYMTKDFWLSIQWWLYLLMAGIVLVSVAGVNEYLKTKGDSLKNKTENLFSNWK